MSLANTALPKPRRRLLRTLLKQPRNLTAFAKPLHFDPLRQERGNAEEAARFGEVMLLEDYISVLHRDGTTSFRQHLATALYGDQQLAHWDEETRVYDPKLCRLTLDRVGVSLPEGTWVPARVTDQPLNGKGNLRLRQLAFAPLRPGVVLHYVGQEDNFQPPSFGPALWGSHFVRTGVPCRRRRFTLAIAAPFTATIRLHHRALPALESTVGDYRVYQWDHMDIGGVECDAGTPPLTEFVPWIDFSTAPSWEPVAEFYRTLHPDSPDEITRLAQSLTSRAATPAEKVTALCGYACGDIRYGRPPQEAFIPASRPVLATVSDLRGDCKDKSALLVALCEACGIRARMAIVLTAQYGRSALLPAPRFDHALVVAEIDGREVWIDPAAGPYAVGVLPAHDQSVKALILDAEEGPRYVETPASEPAEHGAEFLCSGSLDEDGCYEFTSVVTFRGDRAVPFRRAMRGCSDESRARQVEQQATGFVPGAEISDVKVTIDDDLNRDPRLTHKVKLPDCGRRLRKSLLIRIPWADQAVIGGLLAARERSQPLQLASAYRVLERHEIELPPGFEVYEMPAAVQEECAWASYRCELRVEEDRLVCEREVTNRGGIVPAAQFAEFKRFWQSCARSDRTDVILHQAERPVTSSRAPKEMSCVEAAALSHA